MDAATNLEMNMGSGLLQSWGVKRSWAGHSPIFKWPEVCSKMVVASMGQAFNLVLSEDL